MRKCPKCGTELPDEALFCNECGEKMPSPTVEEKKEEPSEAATATETKAASETAAPEAATATETTTAPETKAASETAAPETATATETASSTSGAGNSYTAPIDNSVLAKAQKESKNSNIGLIAVIAVGLLAVILIIVLISSLIGGGYKAPLKHLVNNFNKGNTEVSDYLSCVAPGFAVDLYQDVYGIIKSADKDVIADFDDAVTETFEDLFDDAADTFGDDYKLSFEIRDAERLDDRDIKDIEDAYEELFDVIDHNIDYEDEDIYEDLADELEDSADISLSSSQVRKLQSAVESFMKRLENFKVQDAYEVKVRLVIEGEDDSAKETITFYVIKVNGDWFIDPNSFLSAIGEGSLSSNMNSLLWYLY